MADDIRIKYGSTGFERVARELASIEQQAGGAASWFKPMQTSVRDAEQAGHSFASSFTESLNKVGAVAGGVATNILKLTTVITGLATVAAGAATYAFASWTSGVLKTTESFRLLEISLFGATKSWEAVKTASKFAKEYAAEYPAMYADIMRAIQSFAFVPALKPFIERGDVQKMKEIMTVIQGLTTIRPEGGTQQAIAALQQAMTGRFMSLQFTYGIPMSALSGAAGMTEAQIKESPLKTLEALGKFTEKFVGAETMAMMAKNLGTQVGNLKDKYERWLSELGKTGIYDKVIEYLLKLNEAQDQFMASEKFQQWTEQINTFLESIVSGIEGILTRGIDWQKIATMGDLGAALKQVGKNAIEELKKVWEAAKEPLGNALKGVFSFVGSAAAGAFKEAIIPAMKEMAKTIPEILREGMKQAPMETMGMGFLTGAAVTPGGLVPKLIGGVVGMELTALPTQIETVKGAWSSYDSFMRGLGDKAEGYFRKLFKLPEKEVNEWWGEIRKMSQAKFLVEEGLPELRKKPVAAAVAEKPWSPGAEQAFGMYGAWASMAKTLAEKAGEERAPRWFEGERWEQKRTLREQWDKGELSEKEWNIFTRKFDAETTKQIKLAEFTEDREKKLKTVLDQAIEEKQPGVQAKVFGEMFNIATERGDFAQAQQFMNKSLDAMVEQMRKDSKMAEDGNASLGDIKKSTADTVSAIDRLKDAMGGMFSGFRVSGKTPDDLGNEVRRNSLE